MNLVLCRHITICKTLLLSLDYIPIINLNYKNEQNNKIYYETCDGSMGSLYC